MARLGIAATLVLLLALSAWAQTAAAAPSGNGDALVQQLFALARQATGSVPSLLAPGMMSTIARDELRPGRHGGNNHPALADFDAAFALALALPSSNADPVVGPVRAQVKAEVEQEAVAELARHDQMDAAIQLTRSADVPREPLYNQLIAALAYAHTGKQKPRSNPLDTVAALVGECERVSGEFPYQGVAAWLRHAGSAGLDQMLLVQSGYRWAKGETIPSRVAAAVPFLLAGHRKEPELDQNLLTAVDVLLSTLSTLPADYTGPAHTAARGLMSLLRTLDPVEAAQWQQRWPQFDGAGDALVQNGMDPASGRRYRLQMLLRDPAVVADAPLQLARAQQFTALLYQAEGLRHRQPDQALSLAGLAASMLDHELWPSVLPQAMRLAALEQELGDTNDAAGLLVSSLDEADREARAIDAQIDADDPMALAAMAPDMDRVGTPVLEAYSEAARIDLATTAAHAEAAQFTLLKPLVLARVALVAAIAVRRAARHPQHK